MRTYKQYTDIEIRAISNLYHRYIDANRPANIWIDMPDGEIKNNARKEYINKYQEVINKGCEFVRLNIDTEINHINEIENIKSTPLDKTDINARRKMYDDARNKKENKLIWP